MTIPGFSVDLDSATPVYRQIADGIRAALHDGRLRSGTRLPPTRDLARQIGVNRNTVVSAYQLLSSEGLVESHTGRGTFLASRAAPAHSPTPSPAGAADPGGWFTGFSRAVEGPGLEQLRSIYRVAISSEGISFAGTYPASEMIPLQRFREAMDATLRDAGTGVLSYGPTAGYPALREAIAEAMRRQGSRVGPEGILITNGAQQAIDLVFRTLVDRGDVVVLEEPTYTGALSSLSSLGARLVGVPVDAEGIRTDLLALALERNRPKLIYLQPTVHNPTTGVMGEARRREVLAMAARHRAVIVEDDWAGDLQFEGPRMPTLHALDGGRRVIYLSTFSKKLLPGLRVGWLAGPLAVVERVEALKQIQDFGTSPLIQAALCRFLDGGGLQSHLERVLPAYRRRRDVMLDCLARNFPSDVRWTPPRGGLFVWVTLPAGLNSTDLFLAARRRGVLFSRGELFHRDGSGKESMRLTYGSVSPAQIETGISILGELLRESRARAARETPRGAAEPMPIL
jgi:DNA-binding transcriptional MocR family regulator